MMMMTRRYSFSVADIVIVQLWIVFNPRMDFFLGSVCEFNDFYMFASSEIMFYDVLFLV